jgi:hypothetical protein
MTEPARHLADLVARARQPVSVSFLAESQRAKLKGALHGFEIPYIFDVPAAVVGDKVKGQLLLRQGHSEAAEELYRKALSIAEEQEAKLWELRAAASLARLRRDQGCRAEGRDLLAPIYMAGSPKASTRLTSKKQRRCSTH